MSHFSWSNLDVEMVAFVGQLEDLGPDKAADAQLVPVDEQAATAHTQHDSVVVRVLCLVHVHPVHCQLLGIVQKTLLCLVRCQTPGETSPSSYHSIHIDFPPPSI